MGTNTVEELKTASRTDREFIPGAAVHLMKAAGEKIRWMVRVHILIHKQKMDLNS